MTRLLNILSAGLLAISLGACGFQPMYASGPAGGAANVAVQDALAEVAVAPIPERLGQVVQNTLLDSISPYGAPAAPTYRLEVVLESDREGFGFRPDEAITREKFRLSANYRLVRIEGGEEVLSGHARSNLTYDIVQSDFANFSAQQDAEKRTAKQLVNTIVTRLGLFFRSGKLADPQIPVTTSETK